MKKGLSVLLAAICLFLTMQCVLLTHTQRKNEMTFVTNFCSEFWVFSDRVFFALRDTEEIPQISLNGLSAADEAISDVTSFWLLARPFSAPTLGTAVRFAPAFDEQALFDLQARIHKMTTTVSYGWSLTPEDIEWLLTLKNALINLQDALYQDNDIRSSVFKEDCFSEIFQVFFDSIQDSGGVQYGTEYR